MNLADLNPGFQAKIQSVVSDGNENDLFASRLLELGFIPGSTVACLHKAPLTSNPKSFLIRGMHVALRNEEASKVLISDLVEIDDAKETI